MIAKPRARAVRPLHLSALAVGLLASLLFASAASAQSESCVYSAATHTVCTAAIASGGQATLVVSGGRLTFGATPAPCGAATTTNTDTISIAGTVGTNEILTLDERGGMFGPGFTPESNIPEIEIATTLGDATDQVIVYATEGNDFVAPGQNGLALTNDGDTDVTFSPGIFPMTIYGLGGDDYINGRGQYGAGSSSGR